MKNIVHLAILSLGSFAAAQTVEKRDVTALNNAAQALTSDFADLDLILNGTLAQIQAIKSAFVNGASVALNQPNLTYADVFQLVTPFRTLQAQLLTTLDNFESRKDDIIASSACKDIYTQMGLTWFIGAGFLRGVGSKTPQDGKALWSSIADPMESKLLEAYHSIDACK
ncbi:hypothetical protein NQ176_g4623 [Zarea fungicola]|uniref:Uncharacterized protein n=1 Tax=Zarea fungicola TaxID=93591 RepID=A0ACC1NDP1_9HYPO|nr:hypothetical protein NQ176_g4623 [Lecanicillium fungicola]